MRYGARHVGHDEQGADRVNTRAHDAPRDRKIEDPNIAAHKQIERPGWHPTARNDLKMSRRHRTALRSLAHEGITA